MASSLPVALCLLIGVAVTSLLLSSASLVSAQVVPDQLTAWKVSGCSDSLTSPNATIHCPFATPTVLTIEGSGFSQWAPDNFTVCLGNYAVEAPFERAVLDDNTLTVTTSEQFYLSAYGATQWFKALTFYLGGGRDFDCGQPGLVVRLVMTVDFPVPQVTSVSGCSDVGSSAFNCSQNASLTVLGSGFTTYADADYGSVAVTGSNFSMSQGFIVNDTALILPGGWYCGTQPAPYTNFTFGLAFKKDYGVFAATLYGNGTVTISMAPSTNSSSCGSITNSSSSSTGRHKPHPTPAPAPAPVRSSSALSTAGLIGVLVATSVVLVAVLATVLYWRRRVSKAAQSKNAAWEPMIAASRYESSSTDSSSGSGGGRSFNDTNQSGSFV